MSTTRLLELQSWTLPGSGNTRKMSPVQPIAPAAAAFAVDHVDYAVGLDLKGSCRASRNFGHQANGLARCPWWLDEKRRAKLVALITAW